MFLAPPADIQESGGAFLFHKTLFPMKQKSPPLNYVQGQAVIYLRYHLVWCEAPTLYRMPLHSWSVNADRCVAATKV